MNRLVAMALACAACAVWPRFARAEVARFAVVIGANRGDGEDVALRFAQSDGRRLGDALESVGGFHAEDIIVLKDASAVEVRHALITMNTRIRQIAGESLLFVFYSGHADADSLHLAGTRLPMSELKGLIAGSAATARVLVVDACRSGVLTRVKGGHRAPSFDVHIDAPLQVQGFAILTSSAAGEDSQESDRLGASFFTHYFVSGVLGAADRDRDGRVTLAEAFGYASERTLAATAVTVAGPQHPTYLTDMGGRENLVISQPGVSHQLGVLEFEQPGSYLVHQNSNEGAVVAELAADAPAGRLALDPGRYHVTLRGIDHLLEGDFTVTADTATIVRTDAMQRIAYAQVVRKGGTERRSAWSAFALGGARGEILDLGNAWATIAGARLDLPQLSLELRGGLARSKQTATLDQGVSEVTTSANELSASAVGVRAFDVGSFTFGGGIEVGGLWIDQEFDRAHTPDREAYGLFVGPIGQIDLRIQQRIYLRLESSLLTYFETGNASGGTATNASTGNPVTVRAVLGLGVYL